MHADNDTCSAAIALSPSPAQASTCLIEVEGVSIAVVRKRIKNLNLRVCPPAGDVRLSVPLKTDPQTIHAFLVSKLDWINRCRARIVRQRPPGPQQFTAGEDHYFQGRRYPLLIHNTTGKGRVCLENQVICLYAPAGSDLVFRSRLLDVWYRQQLTALIPELLLKWQPLVGVQVACWGVKKMKTRWGSCNVAARRIWLNLELAKKPLACLEYVLVHELVHLLERCHNDRFYRLMDQFLPGWRYCRAEIDRIFPA